MYHLIRDNVDLKKKKRFCNQLSFWVNLFSSI